MEYKRRKETKFERRARSRYLRKQDKVYLSTLNQSADIHCSWNFQGHPYMAAFLWLMLRIARVVNEEGRRKR